MADYNLRDFRQGRYSKAAVSTFLVPENSVAHSININFDEIVGSAKVRSGTAKLGDTVAAGQTPLGLGAFVGKNGSPNLLLAVYADSVSGTLYSFDDDTDVWTASALNNLSRSAKNRFTVFGNRAFITNNVDGMKDSEDDMIWGTTNSIATIKPGTVFRYKGRLLASSDLTYPSRVFFSSIIDPTASPFITWDVNPTTGDWIDINPDDGGYVTGFSESSTFCLVFKSTGMYRLDTLAKTTDAENIYNIGAVNQESIVNCQGVTYFFSGRAIYQTNGGYPEQISRAGVQDFLDGIPLDNWENVCAGTNGQNVYFSIGDVSVKNINYTNIVLKYSPRDKNWSIHSYSNEFKFFAPYVTEALDLI